MQAFAWLEFDGCRNLPEPKLTLSPYGKRQTAVSVQLEAVGAFLCNYSTFNHIDSTSVNFGDLNMTLDGRLVVQEEA